VFFRNFVTYLPDYNIQSSFNDAVSYSVHIARLTDARTNMEHVCNDTPMVH